MSEKQWTSIGNNKHNRTIPDLTVENNGQTMGTIVGS